MSDLRKAAQLALEALEDPLSFTKGQAAATAIRAALSQPADGQVLAAPRGKWEGGEYWMPLAWQLCADECGEDACNELVWEGGPIPEPWGDRWLKYEHEAKRLISLVHEHAPYSPTAQPVQVQVPEGWRLVTVEPTPEMLDAVVSTMDDLLLGKHAEQQYRDDWSAMLAAAPLPPAQPVGREALSRKALVDLWGDKSDGPSNSEIVRFGREVERAHGITGEGV